MMDAFRGTHRGQVRVPMYHEFAVNCWGDEQSGEALTTAGFADGKG